MNINNNKDNDTQNTDFFKEHKFFYISQKRSFSYYENLRKILSSTFMNANIVKNHLFLWEDEGALTYIMRSIFMSLYGQSFKIFSRMSTL